MTPRFLLKKIIFAVTASLVALLVMSSPLRADGKPENDTQSPSASDLTIKVYKSPSCGCCGDWIKHLEQNGFTVHSVNQNNMSLIKQQLGVPQNLQSCHTGVVNGYLVEGHVPAADVKQMVTHRPAIKGLSVPGMPIGSPGMEMGSRKEAFKVISFKADGSALVVNSYPGKP